MPVLAVNTAVNTLPHTVNLTARVSESQKGRRKLMARTSEGFSEMYGRLMKSRLDVIAGLNWPAGRRNHKRGVSMADILSPTFSRVCYIFCAAASQTQNKGGLTSRFCKPALRHKDTFDVFNPATNCSGSVLWFNLVVLSERQHSHVEPSDLVSVLTALLYHCCLSSPPFGQASKRSSNPEYSSKNQSPVVINRFRSSLGRILLQVLALTCLRSLDDSEERCWRCCSSNYR